MAIKIGTDGNDTLAGAQDSDLLSGGVGDDSLRGNGGLDTLQGGDGNDTLSGDADADTMEGGAGDDYYHAWSADTLVELADGGIDTVLAYNSFTLGAGLENLVLKAGSGARIGRGNDLANALTGNEFNNILNGLLGDDTLAGGEGVDTLFGDGGNDSLDGGNGNDLMRGAAGDDTLVGGAGNDTLQGATGADWLVGGAGDDFYQVDSLDTIVEDADGGFDFVLAPQSFTLSANIENMTLKTGSAAINGIGNDSSNRLLGNGQSNSLAGFGGDDSIEGYAGNDTLQGGDGNDTLNGGQGSDSMAGGAGDDVYYAFNDDTVTELAGEGTDNVITNQNYTLAANVEHLLLRADSTAVIGIGNASVNQITGNAMANSLSGLAGNDTLIGNGGADTLLGGNGDDRLVVTDTAFGYVEGGKNKDTLALDAAGVTLDLTAIADTLVFDIERIDLTGIGDNTLVLNLAEVLNISTSGNSLTVWGDAGDGIHTGTGWTLTATGATVDEGHVLDTWSNGKGTLLIEQGLWVLA